MIAVSRITVMSAEPRRARVRERGECMAYLRGEPV
jgi:hypothetical protein